MLKRLRSKCRISSLYLDYGNKELFIAVGFFAIVFCASLFSAYLDYKSLTQGRFVPSTVIVKNQYLKTKNQKSYTVLKLKDTRGFEYYITEKNGLKDLRGRKGRLFIKPLDVDFTKYLQGFFALSYGFKIDVKDAFWEAKEAIQNSHSDGFAKELYGALLLGISPDKTVRDFFAKLGIAHLIALSGLHLAILGGAVFLLAYYPYRFLQYRYFPYRNLYFDLAFLSAAVLFAYLYFVDFIPSPTRAYIMLILGFLFLYRGVNILSIQTLVLTVAIALAFNPFFLFSLGFWLSVSGVFYIFLFLKYFGGYGKLTVLAGLNIFVYLSMLPIIHYFFEPFSLWQMLSPLLSIGFTLFYPLILILHAFGVGDFFDGTLLFLSKCEIPYYAVNTSIYVVIPYLVISIAAFYRKEGLYVQMAFAASVFLYFLFY